MHVHALVWNAYAYLKRTREIRGGGLSFGKNIGKFGAHIGNLSPGMHVHSMPRQMCGMHVHARLYIPFRPELWQGPKWWQP